MTYIPAPNYTQIPNIILDYWMLKLKPIEIKVIMLICRKTFGWHKSEDSISKSQIIKLTGESATSIDRAIKTLEKNKLIEVVRKKCPQRGNLPNSYKICITQEIFAPPTMALPPHSNKKNNNARSAEASGRCSFSKEIEDLIKPCLFFTATRKIMLGFTDDQVLQALGCLNQANNVRNVDAFIISALRGGWKPVKAHENFDDCVYENRKIAQKVEDACMDIKSVQKFVSGRNDLEIICGMKVNMITYYQSRNSFLEELNNYLSKEVILSDVSKEII